MQAENIRRYSACENTSKINSKNAEMPCLGSDRD